MGPIVIPDLQKAGGPGINSVNGGINSPTSGQEKDPVLKSSNEHLVTVDICYYFGYDFPNSHVRCDRKWNRDAPKPIRDLYRAQVDYLNELTFVANKYLSNTSFAMCH